MTGACAGQLVALEELGEAEQSVLARAPHYRRPAWVDARDRDEMWGVERGPSRACVVRRGGELVGVSTLAEARWPLPCGPVVSLPLRRLTLARCDTGLPDDAAAYDALFEALGRAGGSFDSLYLEYLLERSFLARYLARDRGPVRDWFHVHHVANVPPVRAFIDMPASYGELMERFSKRRRHKTGQKVRKLRREHTAELVRVTRPDQVEAFLSEATSVANRAYERYCCRSLGLAMRDRPAHMTRHLRFMAERGWLRSYLLRADGGARAYVVGYQDDGAYYYWDTAFDPGWSRQRVGSVLHWMLIEDLFEHRRPALVDLGKPGVYKAEYATRFEPCVTVHLLPRRLYPRAVGGAHRAAIAIVDRFKDALALARRATGT